MLSESTVLKPKRHRREEKKEKIIIKTSLFNNWKLKKKKDQFIAPCDAESLPEAEGKILVR